MKEKHGFSVERQIRDLLECFVPSVRAEIIGTFSLALKILLLRYNRKKKEWLGRAHPGAQHPFTLKRDDISGAIQLVDFHIRNTFETSLKGSPHIGITSLNEPDAVQYFKVDVIGTVKDIYGREVVIEPEATKFLYKEPETGKHIEHPHYFMPYRAKRLQWIRATIQRTHQIYEKRESSWTTFLYVGTFLVPYRDLLGNEEDRNYFVVVCRKQSKKPIRFVTAYYCRYHQDLLRILEPCCPYQQ